MKTNDSPGRLGEPMRLPDSAHGQSDFKHGDHPEAARAQQAAPRPVFTSIAAQLFVADIDASCAFFTDKLGFKADFVYGDPPFFGQVSRDNARLALRHLDEPVFVGDIRTRDDLLCASITVETVDEIDQLFKDYQTAEVSFHQALRKEPWGARTFIVVDLDGNLILFAGPGD
jgi:catechol 2,3-dioxygenase-like lactoylglutathione lyase family enzyme